MLSNEFFEKLAAGQKEFENIDLSYADFDGKKLQDFKIKNSKLVFTSMRHCNLLSTYYIKQNLMRREQLVMLDFQKVSLKFIDMICKKIIY